MNKIQLLFDGTDVASQSSVFRSGNTAFIIYDPPGVMAPSSTHTVGLTFADDALPTPHTNAFQYGFSVVSYQGNPAYVTACPSPSGTGKNNGSGVYSAYDE